jgi:hypothetical protein
MTATFHVLDHLGQLSAADLDALPLDQLDAHIRAVGEIEETCRLYRFALHASEDRRFSGMAGALRQQAGKSTGVVRFDVDGFTVIADLPKRPEYDQKKLKDAVEALRRWGENPEDYVTLEVKVAEAKYNAWPPGVRQLFEPARTLKTGKPTYKLERIVDGAGPQAANDNKFEEAI